jgi:signal transduction histidine kinase
MYAVYVHGTTLALGTRRYSARVLNSPYRALERLTTLDARLVDAALAVVLSVGAGVQLLTEEPGNVTRAVWVVGTCLPLVIRRRLPIVCHALQVGFQILAQRTPVSVSLLAIFIGLYSVGVYSRWRVPFLVWLVLGSVWIAIAFPESRTNVPSWASELVGGLAVWLAGSAMHQRRLQTEALRGRAEQLERERDLNLRLARADERQRIARELHDVVAHSVSVMVVQAGAARTLVGRNPERATEALLAVEASGRQALGELRHLLGLLTAQEAEPALAPQPGLQQLGELVEHVKLAGLPVELQVVGAPRTLPPGLDLAAYRIVQEALTNALKYAAGASTHVDVEFEEHELRLEVVDSGGLTADSANGAGRGLLGMQERVAMYGGDLEAGPRTEGGFAVRARLPLDTA